MWAKYGSKNRPRRQVNISSFIGGKYCADLMYTVGAKTLGRRTFGANFTCLELSQEADFFTQDRLGILN